MQGTPFNNIAFISILAWSGASGGVMIGKVD